jgi:hypothetical protein
VPTNKTAITIIITTLAGCAGLCVLSICILAYMAIQIPPELNTLTGGLVGALSAMLAKTSPAETTAQPNGGPTPVVNPPSEPVPTEEAATTTNQQEKEET